MVESKKHTKGRGKRILAGTLHNAAQAGMNVNRGMDAAAQLRIRELFLNEARAHLKAVNFGRKQQGLKPMSIDELVFLIRQRSGSIDRKDKFKK